MSPHAGRVSLAVAPGENRSLDLHAFAACAIAIPLVLVLLGLGSYGLLNNNEGMYAEIAREMAQGGSWIIPHLDGVPYIEKPPLVYWLTALLLRDNDAREFLVRLVPATAGALTLASTWWFAARVHGARAAWLAVLVLGSSIGFLAMSRVLMLDMWLAAMLTTALYAAHALVHQGTRRLALVAGAALALAVLAKGLIAVLLFVCVLAAYVVLLHEPMRTTALGRLRAPWLWIAFGAIALPWHVAAILELPDFAWFYFVNEHVLRFLGAREPHDYYGGPVWYYLPRVALALLPWTFLLLVRGTSRVGDGSSDARRFLWIASIVPLVLLSVSSAKANYYAIVCVPPLAIVIASNIDTLIRRRRVADFAVRSSASAVVLGVLVVLVLRSKGFSPTRSEIMLAAAMLVATLVIAPFIATRLAAAHRWMAACTAIAMISLPVTWFVVAELKAHEPALSARPWFAAQEDLAASGTWIFADFEAVSAVPFYLRAPVAIIDSRSRDLAFAQRRGDGADVFLRSTDIPRGASGLVWYERRRWPALEQSAIGARVSPLGCAGQQCVAALEPAKD